MSRPKLLCIGGPHDGEWISAPAGHGLVHAYAWKPDGDSGVKIDQHTYERRRVGAGSDLAVRAGAQEWTVLVHLGLDTSALDAWLATQGGPTVMGPKPRLPDVPCLRCPDRLYCITGLCMYARAPEREPVQG